MATMTINAELNGIEISFGSKPEQATIDSLKSNGFRWHRAKKLWYAKNTAERLALAESIADEKVNPDQLTAKAAPSTLSLWERCKTDSIPEHNKSAETKEVAAETRKHIKERFPEIKFSCRIGSGGWASVNEVNFYFKSAPFAEDSVYFEAVKKYVKAWLWSFNYDHSDAMTDYFDRNFYETVAADYNFVATEPTEAQKADLLDFDREAEKAREEEEQRREEEFQKSLIEQEESRKAYEERRKIIEAQKAEINSHVRIAEIAEDEKYIISGSMICGIGKECDIKELEERGREKQESALVKRELHFSDASIYNNFCNLFLDDFDFLEDCGGTGTLDKRVTDANFWQLNTSQRESVEWISWDCVAVFLNEKLMLIINPEGYSYSRYVYLVSGDYTKATLSGQEQKEEQTEREEFYIPAPIAEQAEKIEEAQNYTMIYIDSWTMCAVTRHIMIAKKEICRYAQYDNSLCLEYVEAGKRKPQEQYFHKGNRVLIYKGFLPAVPPEIREKKINKNMYLLRSAGKDVDDYMIDVFRHYKGDGYLPEVNTLQF